MKHRPPRFVTVASPYARSRGVRANGRLKTVHVPPVPSQPGELLDASYRALLDASSSAILLLSPGSIILGWNGAAETISGWSAHEALGGRYVDRCVPIEARAPFLATLARVTQGSEVRGCEFPLVGRTGVQTRLSWNMTRVVGPYGNVLGLMAIGTAVVSTIEQEETPRPAQPRVRSEALLVQSAVEEERRRIARELHDEFGQALTGLKFDLAWCGLTVTSPLTLSAIAELGGKVQMMSRSVDALLGAVRETAAALRPAMLDDLGLVPALECLGARFQQRTGTRCTFDVAPAAASTVMSAEVAAALFRITQELLTNVTRHAAASQVHIQLSKNADQVTLVVTDNGKGLTMEKNLSTLKSCGLHGMQERATLLGGHFSIVGKPGGGTTACVSVPVSKGIAS
jgi:PAS domain S-box-containing protein